LQDEERVGARVDQVDQADQADQADQKVFVPTALHRRAAGTTQDLSADAPEREDP
jgi:hypothetical protein